MKKDIKIGDIVNTRHGIGIVMGIKNDMVCVKHRNWFEGHRNIAHSICDYDSDKEDCWNYGIYDVSKIENNKDDSIDCLCYMINDTLFTKKCEIKIDKLENYKTQKEKDMNKVLELYKNKKLEKINATFKSIIDEEYNNLDVVKNYNNLIKEFESTLETMVEVGIEIAGDKYNPFNTVSDRNLYMYSLNEYELRKEIEKKYINDKQKDIKKLEDLVKEVEAQLSLSDNLDYQLDVLIRYEIIDKKTKKVL